MILFGFLAGCVVTTWWYSYLLSFYDTKPLPPRSTRYFPDASSVEFGPIGRVNGVTYPHWKADRGP